MTTPAYPTKMSRKWRSNFSKKIKKIYKTNYAKLSKPCDKRIFSCSASLLRGRKDVLNVVFDFIYKKFKNRSLPIISKLILSKKRVLVK